MKAEKDIRHLSFDEAAAILGMDPEKFRRIVGKGLGPKPIRLGHGRYFTRYLLDEWTLRNEAEAIAGSLPNAERPRKRRYGTGIASFENYARVLRPGNDKRERKISEPKNKKSKGSDPA